MKNIITGLLLVFVSFHTSAQDVNKMLNMGSQEWKKNLTKSEMMCPLPQEYWVNTVTGQQPWKLEKQLVFIHIGDFENPKSLENLLALNHLQFTLSHIKVLFIHQSGASYPSNLTEFQNELNRYDIGVPACFDTTNAIACLPNLTDPKTILIAPEGQIMGEISGWHNIDHLIQIAMQFTNLSMDVYNFPNIPFYGNLPSHNNKSPLLKAPLAIESESNNNTIFVSDYMGNRVLILSEFGQVLDVIGNGRPFFKDGEFDESGLSGPRGLVVNTEQNALYIADSRNRRIRKVSLLDLNITTVLGNGKTPESDVQKVIGNEQAMPYPLDLAIDGNDLYFSTIDAIWKMDLRTSVAVIFSADTLLNQPNGMRINGTEILCSNTASSEIISVTSSMVEPLISPASGHGYQDGKKNAIQFNHPKGAVNFNNELLIADQYNHAIRSLNTKKLKAQTFAGGNTPGYSNGTFSKSHFYLPADLTVLNNNIYVADLGNHAIRKLDSETGKVSNLPITEYEKLCFGYKPPINELKDGPAIKIVKGANTINLKIDLGPDYVFDPQGKSYVDLTTRKRDALAIMDDDLNDGQIAFSIDIESLDRPNYVTMDLYMYVKENVPNGRSYYKATAYLINLDSEAKEDFEPSITIQLE